MKLSEVRDKLTAKQGLLATVFAEAKTDDGEYDFRLVKPETLKTSLGDGLTTSAQIVEKVNEKTAELDALAQEAEALEAAEKAARAHADRDKALKRPPHAQPRGDAPGGAGAGLMKALGSMVAEEKGFLDWHEAGRGSGVTLRFDQLPSDFLAKARNFPTIGSKAEMTTAAGWAPESIRIPGLIVEAVTRPIQLVDIVPMGATGMEQIVYMEETTRTHAAVETAEGGAFAESTFVLTERTSPVRKITDSLPVTDEQLEDVAQVESYINGRLTFGLRQRLDSQIVVGDGAGSNLRGIKNVVGILTQAKGADPIPDAFFKLMTQIRLTGRAQPTHNVIHPTDWEKVRLLRTADGIYIWGNPSEPGPDRMWGLPVVQQDADAAGTGYVGSFLPAWVSLFEKRGIDVQVGFVDAQFTTGKRTIRADIREAFVVFRPSAFGTVTGL